MTDLCSIVKGLALSFSLASFCIIAKWLLCLQTSCFRFPRLMKGRGRRGEDRALLSVKLLCPDSGRKAFPRTLPFIALSGLWSLGNQVFHMIQCFSEKTRGSLGRRKGKWILVGQVAALATAHLCLSWEIKEDREQRGRELTVPTRHPD